MEVIKITKDRILEASSKCPAAKETLKTLFPEVFVNEWDLKINVTIGDKFFDEDNDEMMLVYVYVPDKDLKYNTRYCDEVYIGSTAYYSLIMTENGRHKHVDAINHKPWTLQDFEKLCGKKHPDPDIDLIRIKKILASKH